MAVTNADRVHKFEICERNCRSASKARLLFWSIFVLEMADWVTVATFGA